MTAPPRLDIPARSCIHTAAPAPLADGHDAWHHHVTRIVTVRDEAPDVRTYGLAFRDSAQTGRYRFAAGQFNMLYLPGIGEAAISISSDPQASGIVGHTVKAVGNVTQALARCRVGDEVMLRGPFGTAWPLDDLRGRDLIIAVGGLGLASVRAAILEIVRRRHDYGRVAVLCGAKTPAGLLYPHEYAAWRAADIDVRLIVDGGDGTWSGPVGLVTALFDALDIAAHRTGLLCCGPEPMMQAVATRGRRAGIDAGDIYLSMERNMICAARLCGLCQFGPEFVCRDGPVFVYDRIARFLRIAHL